jgi:hypothetical protein
MLPSASLALSRDYGTWSPTQPGDCPKWLHDTYLVAGDDGKVYSVSGMPPFGYVNELHEPGNSQLQRREDHFGHKVLVANDMVFYDAKDSSKTKVCSLLVKIHVGTHSPDALTNTAHEIHKTGQCEGLESFSTKYFSLFGAPGGFKEAEAEGCGNSVDPGMAPSLSNQPVDGVHRAIPTSDCFLRGSSEDRLRLVESRSIEFWLTNFFGGNFYYTIANPSRLYDPASANKVSRQVNFCYVPAHPLASTLRCQETVAASPSRVGWSDPRSSFRGT